MTAPGDSLDFKESEAFTSKTAQEKRLVQFIVNELKNRPNGGHELLGKARIAELKYGEQLFAVVFNRGSNRVGLMNLFELPEEKAKLEIYLERLREIEDSAKSKRGKK